jgi:RES domain-containing protein
MIVYRIAKSRQRITDLSGTGAYRTGGRWNSKGTYMLYTSENSSLAFLENLVHMDEQEFPPQLFIAELTISKQAPVYHAPEEVYPESWLKLGNLENKILGDRWMSERSYLAIRVQSAVNQAEFNYLLNPLFPAYHELVKIASVTRIDVDDRLVKQ